MNHISMSMASSLEYCKGYNDAVDGANREIEPLHSHIAKLDTRNKQTLDRLLDREMFLDEIRQALQGDRDIPLQEVAANLRALVSELEAEANSLDHKLLKAESRVLELERTLKQAIEWPGLAGWQIRGYWRKVLNKPNGKASS